MKKCIICGSSDFNIKSERFCSQKCIHAYGSKAAHNKKIKCEICDKLYSTSNIKRHLKTHEIKQYHYFCENCGKEVFNIYGSGRFCSSKCARGFSTKAKRKEINNKVSKRLKGYTYPERIKIDVKEKECPICGDVFKKQTKTCSKECGIKLVAKKNLGKRYKIKDTSNMGGPRPGGGYSKPLPYTTWLGDKIKLNQEEIKVAEILDKYKLNWKRNNNIGFPYITKEGKSRKFYPDFVVNENEFIEYKGWITPDMDHKMNEAVKHNDLNLIIVVGSNKRYLKYGLSLEEFEKTLINI